MDNYYDQIFAEVPDCIDFDFITVKNETFRSIFLTNNSDMSILFRVDHGPGYVFEPREGLIQKSKKIEIRIKIVPSEATVLISNAKITLDNKRSKIIKMSSISKYPYLRINKSVMEFGSVPIGKSKELELIITNAENVPAKFIIRKQSTQPGKHPEIFFLSDTTGEIPPNSNFLLKIQFKPFFPDQSSYEIYQLRTIGGNQITFTCQGSCQPMMAWLGAKHVDFKSIPLGSQTTKLLRIYNASDLPTEYQMLYDNSGAFIIKETQGLIPAKSNLRINITFRPYETNLYYDRIFCLVRNHFLLTLDVFGSCHDLLIKTAQLNQKLIDAFRFKLLKGLFFGKTSIEGELIDTLSVTKSKPPEEPLTDFTSQIQLHKEMFWEYTSPNRMISFDTDHIDFNYGECGKVSEPYILKVTNNSTETLKLKWIYDKPVNVSNLLRNFNIFNVDTTIFFVQPEEKILEKKQTTEFKVFFKPNRNEYYFYTDLPLTATIAKQTKLLPAKRELKMINKNKLSETGRDLLTQSADFNSSSKSPLTFKSSLMKSMAISKRKNLMETDKLQEIIDPPVTNRISIVGHSFGPGSQIFIPIFEMSPKKEIFFPPSTLNQSLYQTLKISNKSDTPLYYKLSSDPLGVFRAYRKYGLIPANQFHLICIEFCPKDTTVYRFPLRIVFNHDSRNMKTLMLNGLCTDPVIKIDGIGQDIYFPPSYVGIKNKKTIEIKNLSPIKIHVNISIKETNNAAVEVFPNSFDMEVNMIKKIDLFMCPTMHEDVFSKMRLTAERVYDPNNESLGIFNPGSSLGNQKIQLQNFDKRTYTKDFNLIGKGSDGELKVEPELMEFGTVKVGFKEKLSFSIFNPTITNFHIKILPEIDEDKKFLLSMLNLDFTDGLINSFCKKDVLVTFSPTTRCDIDLKLNVFATSNNEKHRKGISNISSVSKSVDNNNQPKMDTNKSISLEKIREETKEEVKEEVKEEQKNNDSFKCSIQIKARGDYPLIKIVDIRNNMVSNSILWKNFNVDQANEELQKKLTDEEIHFISDSASDKKEMKNKLKCFKLDFGKFEYSKKKGPYYTDIYLTLKNEGGVRSEFFFKFPEDIAITREIWMDPVEETNNDIQDYQVLKNKIFEIYPREKGLEPGECCNIKLRYNVKERGEHKIKLNFQIVHGKPLLFELCGQTVNEKTGVFEIHKNVIDFGYVPIGYMNYIATPVELSNEGPIKMRYSLDMEAVEKFNAENDNEIFKVENIGDVINEKDKKYFTIYFRPLTSKQYKMELEVKYFDEYNCNSKFITIVGNGFFSPKKEEPPKEIIPLCNLPHSLICANYENTLIRKCGLNLEVLDFGKLKFETKSKTIIMYNFSMSRSFNFDFLDPGFLVKDEISILPNKGTIEPNSHILIKIMLTSKEQISNYEGDLKINVVWNQDNSSFVGTSKTIEREAMYIRIIKRSVLEDIPSLIEPTYNPNMSFVENVLSDVVKDIFCDNDYQQHLLNNLDQQPMSLYPWTNNETGLTQEETRKEFLDKLITREKKDIIRKKVRNKKMSSKENTSQEDKSEENKLLNEDFGEDAELELDEKYTRDLMNKYKFELSDMNEKVIAVNKTTRNLISDTILENTIYNIIAEGVYGETDLTEKPRIYFFYKK